MNLKPIISCLEDQLKAVRKNQAKLFRGDKAAAIAFDNGFMAAVDCLKVLDDSMPKSKPPIPFNSNN